MPLTDDEVRDVLARAEEIQQSLHAGTEIEALLAAAEDVGISRQAMERAFRERLDLSLSPPVAGSLVFARSANDKFYTALVLESNPQGIRVRFLRGTEHVVAPDQVRPASFIPGERVMVEWPWWGPWTCTVIGYDAGKQRVKVSDGWGYTRTFPIAEVWLPPRKAGGPERSRRGYRALLGTGVALGAVLGSLLTLLLT